MLKFSEYSKIPGIKINENYVKVSGNIFTVTFTYDVPVALVEEYRQKVKNETGQNIIEPFGAQVVAEKMMKYTLDQFMNVDNIPVDAFINVAKTETENTPEIAETDTTAEDQPAEPAATEVEASGTEKPDTMEAEEDEEESNYMNMYTVTGQPVSSGLRINPPTHKSPKNIKLGLHEGLTDKDLKF
jgi:hypothetical protein